MYEETRCFEENALIMSSQTMANMMSSLSPQPLMAAGAGSATNSHNSFEDNLNISMEEHLSNRQNHHIQQADATEMDEFQNHLGFNGSINMNNTHLVQELTHDSNPIWVDPNSTTFHLHDHQMQDLDLQIQENNNITNNPYFNSPAPDLLNLFNLPRGSQASNISLSIPFQNMISNNIQNSATGIDNNTTMLYDPLLHLNLPPQPPLFRDLFQTLPHGYNNLEVSNSREESLGAYEDGDGSGVLEFTREIAHSMRKKRDGKLITKHYTTERQRRVQMKDKFKLLESLVPNPSKPDRASIVADAIKYIKELLRTVTELKLLVEKKRCSRERSLNMKPLMGMDPDYHDQSYNLRSSWLQRKCKDTEVDVRIIDDEVTIKLVQRNMNSLLIVSKLLDDLHLDLHHLAGGHIGDYYSFLFNTKIYEGSSVYASAIANKLIEVLDKHYAANPPSTST